MNISTKLMMPLLGTLLLCAISRGGELNVAAAANLQYALDGVNKAFEAENPGVKVKAVFGSSGNFVSQILNKAPFDVFISADTDYPQKLVDAGVARKDSFAIYAVGRLVLWAPATSKLDFERDGLKTLCNSSIAKIAIANPKLAPYGRAAEAALKNSGVYEQVKGKLVLGENITQAAQYIQSGAADVGLIAESLTYGPAMKDKGRAWRIPEGTYPKLEQALVILDDAKDMALAVKYRDFILDEKGLALLKPYGFGSPRGADEH